MSVSVIIRSPQNELENSFYIPVSTEVFFEEYWQPACEELRLKWISSFQTGVDILEDDLPYVIDELRQLKSWAEKNLSKCPLEYMKARIELLEDKLPQAFERKGVKLFIG